MVVSMVWMCTARVECHFKQVECIKSNTDDHSLVEVAIFVVL